MRIPAAVVPIFWISRFYKNELCFFLFISVEFLRLFFLEMIHFHAEQQHEIPATIDEIHKPIDEVM